MRTYVIAYDLAAPECSAPLVAARIMSLGVEWARPLPNMWYVRTNLSPDRVEAALKPYFDDDDGLLIQRTRGEAAVFNTVLRWSPQRRSQAGAPATALVAPPAAVPHNVVQLAALRGGPANVEVATEIARALDGDLAAAVADNNDVDDLQVADLRVADLKVEDLRVAS